MIHLKHINYFNMKQLRKFNEELSSTEEIKRNLEDILIDFSDRHIPVDVHMTVTHRPKRYIGCEITLGTEPMFVVNRDIFITSDYKDEFLRVFDYMESEGYDFSSLMYEFKGEIQTLRITNIGLGIDAISNQLFNGIDETCYLNLYFRKR